MNQSLNPAEPKTILLLNRFFGSDTAATGQLLKDLADHLTATGAIVQVISGPPGYAGTSTGRVAAYLKFLTKAAWQGLTATSPDVVVSMTDPPLLAVVGMAIQRLRGSRHVIWEMDVYPDVAIDLGVMKPGGLPARFFRRLADIPRHRADAILVLGECMRDRLLSHGISPEKLLITENWAEPEPATPSPTGPLSLIYSGNFGLAHDVETLANTMAACRNEDIRFIFSGGGARNSWLQDFCRTHGLTNAQFLPHCDRQDLGARLASAHIGLVTQKNECLGSVVPSKTYGIMAAGRPVLFIGPKESTPARIIARHGCGWQVDCGDAAGLAALLRNLNDNPEAISDAGHRARQAFLDNYDHSIGVARISAVILISP